MIKPLLQVIPALSGNIKLGCELDKYTQIDDNTFSAICRKGYLYPLSSNMFQSSIGVSLLHSSWEYDITKFYNIYSDVFFENTFTYDKNNILKIYSLGNIINDRNVDVEFGCKRVSYQKTNKQLNFFAPIYCDNVNDIPDYFEITIDISNKDLYKTTKTIRIDLKSDNTNYLAKYLKCYYSKIDDNVIYMLPNSKQALYYGIDVKLGGFNTFVDNIISKIFTYETTVNGYDACISGGFKRNHLIIRQIMPLAFYFNINDILTENEKRKYKFGTLNISGAYYKDNKQLSFYKFDDNYDKLSLPTKVIDKYTGKFTNIYKYDNVLSLSDHIATATTDIEEYKFSNKLNKFYNRWMLKYSDEKNPYITNTNYVFSKNQGLQNMYYQYPQNYYWSTALCNIIDNNINLLLPIGTNIEKYYSEYQFIVNKYLLSLNNYVSNWFDMTEQTNIDYILNNTEWGNVHQDGKIFYKGVLYDFNKMYKSLNPSKLKKIDKFAILFHVDSSQLFDNSTIKNYIYADACITTPDKIENANIRTEVFSNIKNNDTDISETETPLFDVIDTGNTDTNTKLNYKFELNQYFTYNTTGTGKYVNINDLPLYKSDNAFHNNYYEYNKYYELKTDKIDYLLHLIQDKIISVSETKIYKDYIIDSYVVLEIPFVNNIKNIIHILNADNSLYFSLGNHNSIKHISELNINYLTNKKQFYECVFYKRITVIAEKNIIKLARKLNIINDSIGGLPSIEKFIKEYVHNSDTKYTFHPLYKLDNNIILNNVFVKINNTNVFCENTTSISNLSYDKDLLYIDPYKIKTLLNNYHTLSGLMYIKHIDKKYITLSDFVTDNNVQLFISESDNKDLILDKLNYKYSYIGYYNNKYDVEKLITDINSIFISEQEVALTNTINTTYSLEKRNSNWETTYSYKEYISGESQTITAYTYDINVNDKLITNIVEHTDNIYRNNSSAYIYAYGYNVNYSNNTVILKNYYGYTFELQCKNLEDTYTTAYNCGLITYMKMMSGIYSYVPNHNGIGTYFYTNSYIFKHPQYLIKAIHNIGFVTTYFSTGQDHSNKIYTNDNIKYELCVYSYIPSNIDATYISYSNPVLSTTPIRLEKLINTLNINVAELNRFAKVKNKGHLKVLFYNIYGSSNNCINKLYLKIRYIKIENNVIEYPENSLFYSLFDIFKNIYKNVTDDRLNSKLQDFIVGISDIDECLFKLSDTLSKQLSELLNVDISFIELYYKDDFILLSKGILNNIINFNSDNNYKDLYIYRLEKDNDISAEVAFYSYDKLNTNNINGCYISNNSNCIVPFFNDIYTEDKHNTVLYQSYILNTLSEVTFTNGEYQYVFYRYNVPDKMLLCDISSIYNTNEQSIIYDTPNNNYTTYSYQYSINDKIYTVYDPEKTQLIGDYMYYSSTIPTYDKYEIKETNFATPTDIKYNVSNISSDIFNKYKLNTYTYNGVNYGFYILDMPLNNINSVFNITFNDMNMTKYFTYINGINIIDNHKYLTDIFKLLIPIVNYNIITKLYEIPFANNLFKTTFNKRYSNIIENGVNHIRVNEQYNNNITLYRYYDNIIPYLYKTSIIENDYALKTTRDTDVIINGTELPYYTTTQNIYNYLGIKLFEIKTEEDNSGMITQKIKESNETHLKQLEYKFFNDNQFINLETEIVIHIGDNLVYNDLMYYQKHEVIKKYFSNYVNNYKQHKFSDDELLFLYNKYSVILLSNPTKLTNNYTEKIYSLTYKFNLN